VKNKVILGVIVGVVVLCTAIFGVAAYKILKRPRVGAGLSGRVARDTAIVGVFDLRPLRSWQPARELREQLMQPPQNASEPVREAAQRYREVQQRCGFDPWEKVDAVNVGIEQSVLAATDASAVVAFVDGSYAQADADRCLRYLAEQARRTLAPSTVGRRTVLTEVASGEQPGPRTRQYVPMAGSTMVTEQSYTQRALAVLDGDAPSLATDAPVARMMTRLGAGVFLGVSANVAELRARQAQTVDRLIDDLVRSHPGATDLVLLRQARMGGVALAVLNGSLTVTARIEEPTEGNARSLTGALTAVIQQRRPQALEALQSARQSQAFLRLTLGALPGMGERFQQLDDGASALEQVLNQVAARTEGSDAVVSTTVSTQQVTTIQRGLRALAEVINEASRMNPLGGMFGGGGRQQGGLELGLPRLQAPTLQVPTL
jgi:hypothetical protein